MRFATRFDGFAQVSFAALAALVLAGTATAEPYCEIVPRTPLGDNPPYPGGAVLNGNQITVAASASRLWFDIYAGGWSPQYALALGCTLFPEQSAGVALASVPCDGSGDPTACFDLLGEGSYCETTPEGSFCAPAFGDLPRWAEVRELVDVPAELLLSADVNSGGSAGAQFAQLGAGVFEDPGVPVYLGTVVFDIVDDVDGTVAFAIGQTVLSDDPSGQPRFSATIDDLRNAEVIFRRRQATHPWKSRFVSIPTDELGIGALRVRGVEIAGNPGFDGQDRWVGAPFTYPLTRDPAPTGLAATTQCEPHVQDWSSLGTLDIGGPFISPGRGTDLRSRYEVEFLSVGCLAETGPCDGPVFDVETSYWGDLVEPFETGDPQLSQPNVLDISAAVDVFLGFPGAPTKLHALLADDGPPGFANPQRDVLVTDIIDIVESFLGSADPHGGPQPCP